MEVYRIVFEKYADRLYAPGFSGRWNHDGEFVVYAGSNRSLCSLENMVHKMGQGVMGSRFTVMVLELPDEVAVTALTLSDLPDGWNLGSSYHVTQPLGSRWYETGQTLVLKVPSAVVPAESNFVINARHPDFPRITIKAREPFQYDHRFLEMDKELITAKKKK